VFPVRARTFFFPFFLFLSLSGLFSGFTSLFSRIFTLFSASVLSLCIQQFHLHPFSNRPTHFMYVRPIICTTLPLFHLSRTRSLSLVRWAKRTKDVVVRRVSFLPPFSVPRFFVVVIGVDQKKYPRGRGEAAHIVRDIMDEIGEKTRREGGKARERTLFHPCEGEIERR